MHLADSGVWIDFFNGAITPQTDRLAELISHSQITIGDMIVTEVLQGFTADGHYEQARSVLLALPMVSICDRTVALLAAAHYRALRKRGITIRKTIDCLIATRCILDGLPLLYCDRDFDPFVEHFDLQSAL